MRICSLSLNLRALYYDLKAEYDKDTLFLSHIKTDHPALLQAIAEGPEIVHYAIEDLSFNPNPNWFALEVIFSAGKDIIPKITEDMKGRFDEISKYIQVWYYKEGGKDKLPIR